MTGFLPRALHKSNAGDQKPECEPGDRVGEYLRDWGLSGIPLTNRKRDKTKSLTLN